MYAAVPILDVLELLTSISPDRAWSAVSIAAEENVWQYQLAAVNGARE
jgi:hypothetical protein